MNGNASGCNIDVIKVVGGAKATCFVFFDQAYSCKTFVELYNYHRKSSIGFLVI